MITDQSSENNSTERIRCLIEILPNEAFYRKETPVSERHQKSLLAFLQEVTTQIRTEAQPPDQHRQREQSVIHLLQAYGKDVVRPLPGQDMQEVRGQDAAKRALEVAAAGAHHLLLIGPPGAGKTLLARTVASIVPLTAVPSPLRLPDAFMDDATFVRQLTQAHGGILLLENIGRFPLSLLESLRQAVESHDITLSNGEVFPAHFLLIATMTPCVCGFFNDPIRACRCAAEEILQYRQRIQEVVNACFDIHVEIPRIGEHILDRRPGEGSADIRSRVEHARAKQYYRYTERSQFWVNADLESADEVHRFCAMSSPSEKLLQDAIQQLHFTPQKILRLLCLARTIADLSASERIEVHHLAEAIHYRSRL